MQCLLKRRPNSRLESGRSPTINLEEDTDNETDDSDDSDDEEDGDWLKHKGSWYKKHQDIVFESTPNGSHPPYRAPPPTQLYII